MIKTMTNTTVKTTIFDRKMIQSYNVHAIDHWHQSITTCIANVYRLLSYNNYQFGEACKRKESGRFLFLMKQHRDSNGMTDHRHRKRFDVGLTLPIWAQHRDIVALIWQSVALHVYQPRTQSHIQGRFVTHTNTDRITYHFICPNNQIMFLLGAVMGRQMKTHLWL